MMGTKEFTSGVVYRYGALSISALKENVKENLPQLISQFLKAFVESIPKGAQNGFAANTLPYALYVTVREDRPLTFVSAFESPVVENGEGYRKKAAERLKQEVGMIYKEWAKKPVLEFTVGHDFEDLGPQFNLQDLYAEIEKEFSRIGDL